MLCTQFLQQEREARKMIFCRWINDDEWHDVLVLKWFCATNFGFSKFIFFSRGVIISYFAVLFIHEITIQFPIQKNNSYYKYRNITKFNFRLQNTNKAPPCKKNRKKSSKIAFCGEFSGGVLPCLVVRRLWVRPLK